MVVDFLAYGELGDLHQLRTSEKSKPEEDKLLFSFPDIHILVADYAWIHSIAVVKCEILSHPHSPGSCSQALQGAA